MHRISRTTFPERLAAADVIELETDVGPLLLHRDDLVMTPFIGEHGCWEREESDFLRATLRPGDTFLDVGANVGYMTVLGAKAVGSTGRVIAVEPESRNLRLLRANLWRAGVDAEVLPVAAYSRTDYINLVMCEQNRGDHQVHEGLGEGELVPSVRLDELFGELSVDVVKIDTQGVDHEVLEGMAGLIRRNPAIIVLSEFWLTGLRERGIDPASVLGRYVDMGFTLSLLGPDGRPNAAMAEEVVAACEAWEGLFVNVVLTGLARRST